MYEKGRLYVFILQDAETNAIRGVCDELEVAQEAVKQNEKWGFPATIIEAYRVKTITDSPRTA